MFWQNRTSLPQAKRHNAFLRQHGNQLGCCPSPDPASMARNLPLLLAVRFPATRFHQVLLEASLGWFIDVCSHMQPPRLDLGQSFASGCCRGEPGGGCLLIHVITMEDDSVIYCSAPSCEGSILQSCLWPLPPAPHGSGRVCRPRELKWRLSCRRGPALRCSLPSYWLWGMTGTLVSGVASLNVPKKKLGLQLVC